MNEKEEEVAQEEEIYRMQISASHAVLGQNVVPKYDTGEPIE